jgi:hypothetical protein
VKGIWKMMYDERRIIVKMLFWGMICDGVG